MNKINVAEAKQFDLNRILIVENEDSLRNKLARFLSLRKYDVSTAANGVLALELIRSNKFQVVLIDLRLPDMNGIDILKEIALTGLSTASLVITGHATLNTVIDAFNHGAFDYLEKPFSLTELEHKIRHFYFFASAVSPKRANSLKYRTTAS